jgi:hypothetical protein
MPLLSFDTLPDTSRLWIFSASQPVTGENAERLFSLVDDYLDEWKAHGTPLHCARDWSNDRFLAVAVDEAATGASGCSIDALFRILQDAQVSLGTTLVGSSRVYYRASDGTIECVSRPEFVRRRSSGMLPDDTPVFDTSVTNAGDYRTHFERALSASWHGQLA